MSVFSFKNEKSTSLFSLYYKIKSGKKILHSICALPEKAQALLKLQAGLGGGGVLSFYPVETGGLIVRIRCKRYADAHACVRAIEHLFQAEKGEDGCFED